MNTILQHIQSMHASEDGLLNKSNHKALTHVVINVVDRINCYRKTDQRPNVRRWPKLPKICSRYW